MACEAPPASIRAAREASSGSRPRRRFVLCGDFHVRPELVFQVGVAPGWKQRSREDAESIRERCACDLPDSRLAPCESSV